jgi:hypothetical protein
VLGEHSLGHAGQRGHRTGRNDHGPDDDRDGEAGDGDGQGRNDARRTVVDHVGGRHQVVQRLLAGRNCRHQIAEHQHGAGEDLGEFAPDRAHDRDAARVEARHLEPDDRLAESALQPRGLHHRPVQQAENRERDG